MSLCPLLWARGWGSGDAPCCVPAPGDPRQPQTLLLLCPGVGAQMGQGFELQQPKTRLLVTAGDTLNLNCTTSGDVLIGHMKWLKVWGSRSETVYGQTGSFPRVTRVVSGSDTDFSIRISDVRPEDAGTYYCVKFIKSVVGEEEFRRGKGTEVSVHGEWGSLSSSRWEPALPGAAPGTAQPGGLCLGRAGMGKGLGGRSQERVLWAIIPGHIRAPMADPAPCSPGAGQGWQSPV